MNTEQSLSHAFPQSQEEADRHRVLFIPPERRNCGNRGKTKFRVTFQGFDTAKALQLANCALKSRRL